MDFVQKESKQACKNSKEEKVKACGFYSNNYFTELFKCLCQRFRHVLCNFKWSWLLNIRSAI